MIVICLVLKMARMQNERLALVSATGPEKPTAHCTKMVAGRKSCFRSQLSMTTIMMKKRIIPLCTLSALIAAPIQEKVDASHLVKSSTTTRLRRRGDIRSSSRSRRRELDATSASTHYNVFSIGTQVDLLDSIGVEKDQAADEVTSRQFTGPSDVCELNSGGLYGRPSTTAIVYQIEYLYQIYVTGGTSQAILLSRVGPDLDKVVTEGILPAFFDCAPISNRRRDRSLQAINGKIDAVSSRPPDQIAFGALQCRGNRFPGTDCYVVEGALSVFARGFNTQQEVETVVTAEIQKVIKGNALRDNIPQVKAASSLNDDLTIAEPIPSPTVPPTSPSVPIIPTAAPVSSPVQPPPTVPIIPTPVPVAPTPASPPISNPITQAPTRIPTLSPTSRPTNAPTTVPTRTPTASPTVFTAPTPSPIGQPTPPPVRLPTRPVPSRPGPDRPSLTFPPDIGDTTASPVVPVSTSPPALNGTAPAPPTAAIPSSTPVFFPTEPSAPTLFTSPPTAAPTRSSTTPVEKQNSDNSKGLAWWAWLLIIGSVLGVLGYGYSFYRKKYGKNMDDEKRKIGMSGNKSDEFGLVDKNAANDDGDGGDVFSYIPPSSSVIAKFTSSPQSEQDSSVQFTSPRFDLEHALAVASPSLEDLDPPSSSSGSEEKYRNEDDESEEEGSYDLYGGDQDEEVDDYEDDEGDDFEDEEEYDDGEEEYNEEYDENDDGEEYDDDDEEEHEQYSDTDWEDTTNIGWEEDDDNQESFGPVSFGEGINSAYDENMQYVYD